MDENDPRMQMAVLQARIDEQMKTIFNLVNEVRQGQQEMTVAIAKMDSRMDGVEQSLSKAQPTLDDYIEVKHKIVGAGRMGALIWTTAISLVGVLVYFKDTIIGWWTK